MKHLTGKYREKGMYSKSLLNSWSDFFLFVCPPPKNKPILILLYVFSQFIFSFFSSFWEAEYLLFCPSLPFPLLSAHLCCFICWCLKITGSPSNSFPSLSLAFHFSFLLLSPSLCHALLFPPALFFLIEILVTLDLFCKDHKAVRPLGR